MGLRYPLAVACAYLAFLLLLRLWLRTKAEDYLDIDPPLPSGSSLSSFDAACVDGESSEAIGETLSAGAQADEFALPLAVILFVLAAALSMSWVVYSAPVLFAELLVDGALAAGLYRKLRRAEPRHWLETAIKRSWRPFVATALFLGLFGAGMGYYAPEAKTLGGVIEHVQNR